MTPREVAQLIRKREREIGIDPMYLHSNNGKNGHTYLERIEMSHAWAKKAVAWNLEHGLGKTAFRLGITLRNPKNIKEV